MPANWRNRTLFHGDNLGFLRAMNWELYTKVTKAADPQPRTPVEGLPVTRGRGSS